MRGTLATMNYLNLYLQLLWLVNIFGFGASSCNDQQQEINGLCCDKCPPGHYLEKFCTTSHQTVCKPCDTGYFSEIHSVFDRCKECRICKQEYTQKCTVTTDARCFCRPGFLCSNNICSECEKDKCVSGEKHRVTAVVVNAFNNLTNYTYECEPICLDHSYYDEKKNICMPRTSCSALGLAELFAGNKTLNAICQSQSHETQKMYVVVIISLVLLSVTIIVVFSYLYVKIKKTKATAIETGIATECYQLSKEESGPKM